MPIAALAPLIIIAVCWVAYCLWDLSNHDVKSLPKWAWGLIIVASVPFGGIIYFVVGRDQA